MAGEETMELPPPPPPPPPTLPHMVQGPASIGASPTLDARAPAFVMPARGPAVSPPPHTAAEAKLWAAADAVSQEVWRINGVDLQYAHVCVEANIQASAAILALQPGPINALEVEANFFHLQRMMQCADTGALEVQTALQRVQYAFGVFQCVASVPMLQPPLPAACEAVAASGRGIFSGRAPSAYDATWCARPRRVSLADPTNDSEQDQDSQHSHLEVDQDRDRPTDRPTDRPGPT